jgi:hypothetical protein
VAEEKFQSELARLRIQQSKARGDEVFGGFSKTEKREYDARATRIHDLETQLHVAPDAFVRGAANQRRQWNKTSETDTPQSAAHQSYRSREQDSSEAFAESLTKRKRSRQGSDSEKDPE